MRSYIECDRSPDYTFRVRTIFRQLIGDQSITVYIDSGSTTTDYAVDNPGYHYLGGLYRARNVGFSSTPEEVEGVTYDAFDDDYATIVPEPPVSEE